MLLNRMSQNNVEMQNYIFYLCHKMPDCTVDKAMLLKFVILVYYYWNNEQELKELLQAPNPSLKIEEKSEKLNTPQLRTSVLARTTFQRAIKCSYASLITKFNLTLRELSKNSYLHLETTINTRGAITIRCITFHAMSDISLLNIEDKLIHLLDCLYNAWFPSLCYYQALIKEGGWPVLASHSSQERPDEEKRRPHSLKLWSSPASKDVEAISFLPIANQEALEGNSAEETKMSLPYILNP